MLAISKEIIKKSGCLYCGNPVFNSNAKMGRKKFYCSDTCKVKDWQKMQVHAKANEVIKGLVVSRDVIEFLKLLSDKTIVKIGKDIQK